MSEDVKCYLNVKNTTGGLMTQTGNSLPWGKWMTTPPTQIGNGTVGSFGSQGAKGSATGTQGSVTYQFADNATSCTISWDIPYSSANSGGMTLNGTGVSNYTGQETDSGYVNVVSFPSGGSSPTVYFALGAASTTAESTTSFTRTVAERFAQAHSDIPLLEIDIAAVARAADCGEISGEDLIKLFQGKTVATAADILRAQGVPPADLVAFVSNRSLIAPREELRAAIEFADYASPVLEAEKELYDLAQRMLSALRAMEHGRSEHDIDSLANEMEAAKALLLAQRHNRPFLPQVNALDAILGCVYMDTGAALAQAGGCARRTATDKQQYDKIGAWQRDYLLDLVS